MYDDLSKKQNEILFYIKKEINDKGYPPSIREICKGVNLSSTSTVHGHLNTLEEKGFIRKDPSKPRAIEVIDQTSQLGFENKEVVHLPIVGNVAAGVPILATQNIEDSYPVPKEMISSGKDMFLLNVEGESMINAGIMDGDLVLVESTKVAENGEIVVALIDDESTIKRFYKEDNIVRLQPENDSMDPIYVRNLSILGKVKGLFRKF